MGVLKVWDGSEWKKIGCGGAGAVSAPNGWSISPPPASVLPNPTVFSVTSPGTATDAQLIKFTGSLLNEVGATLNTTNAALGIGPKTFTGSDTQTFNFGGSASGGTHYILATSGGSPDTVLAIWVTDTIPVTTGRLKLHDGTQWVVEKCDDSGGGTVASWNFDASTEGWAASSNCTLIRSAFGYNSTHSLEVSRDAPGSQHARSPIGTSGFAVTPGVTYSLSLAVYSTSNAGIATRFVWIDSAGTELSMSTESTSSGLTQNTWVYAADVTTATAPIGATYGAVQVRVTNFSVNGSPLAFDAVQVTSAVTPHPLKLWDGTTWQTVACMIPA